MDLDTIVTRTRRMAGDASSGLDVDEIKGHIQRVYRFEIPDQVSDCARRGTVTWSTVASQAEYDLDTHTGLKGVVIAPRRPVRLDPIEMWLTTDEDRFWATWEETDLTEGSPTDILHRGRTLVLRPVPDAVYSILMPASMYRAAMPTAGLEYEPEALACAAGAAMQIAADLGEHAVAADAGSMYEARILELKTRSASASRSRPQLRSF